MIESIVISQTSSYTGYPQKLFKLKAVNYIFGANGAGKTTIGRIIANQENYPSCEIAWKNNIKADVFVYNKDFVERNFDQSQSIKGVFTLGESRSETIAEIEQNNKQIQDCSAKITNCLEALNGGQDAPGKIAELSALEVRYKDIFWLKKQKYDEIFQSVFEGYRANAEFFKNKILSEKNDNKEPVQSFSALEKKAKTIFSDDLKLESSLTLINISKLFEFERNQLFQKKIIGQSDVSISEMIDKLGNSDWVRAGIDFYSKNDNHCPFCQKAIEREFERLLLEYFDDAYQKEVSALKLLCDAYLQEVDACILNLNQLLSVDSRYLNKAKLKLLIQELKSLFVQNKQLIDAKMSEVSRSVTLYSSEDLTLEINALIGECNKLILDHNKTIENIENERASLKASAWAFIVDELSVDISAYFDSKESLTKAIEGLNAAIKRHESERKALEAANQIAEKKITSVKPTVDAINALLQRFGYQGFQLSQTDDAKSYRLVRSSGANAKDTLSEGEKTFVTFLYFFHLLLGGESESRISSDRIVVFDDPVSSLDSNILFVVGSLIRTLIEKTTSGSSHIKQIFVITHNIYFHKEVCFNVRRKGPILKDEETFWLVRKPNGISSIENCQENPVKTSYELLWKELGRKDLSKQTVQNTIRRILENYFKFFGGVDPKQICNNLPENDRAICNSLFSWVNDGSHYIVDDLYVSLDDVSIENYLRIFKEIFIHSGHESHYQMMIDATTLTAQNNAYE
jgi:wobble nucleotide-excising tRNase